MTNRSEPEARAARESERPPLPGRSRGWIRRALLFVTCVLVLDALIGEQGLAETVRARRQHRLALASLTQLRAENARLRDEVRRLTQDPRTIEHIARGELGLISPGEILIVVKDRSSR